MSTDPALDLTTRERLPDALRVLVGQYPRTSWEEHANFGEMTRFWLDRHIGFRSLNDRLITEAQTFLVGDANPRSHARSVARLCGFFLNQLHGHHHIEDDHYFPLLAELDAGMTAGFALLETDHVALDARIHALAEAGNGVIRAAQDGGDIRTASAAYLAQLEAFRGLLDRHLTDEEEIVVPVILEHGPQFLA